MGKEKIKKIKRGKKNFTHILGSVMTGNVAMCFADGKFLCYCPNLQAIQNF